MVPHGHSNRPVWDGGSLASSKTGTVYALKGNNTCEFYSYTCDDYRWTTRDSIPAFDGSGRRRRVKKGAALTSAAGGRLYALKGNNTREFWQYDPSQSEYRWHEMSSVPLGPSGKTVREGAGASVVVDQNGTEWVYVLKGSNTTDFYRYDTEADTWQTLAGPSRGPSGDNFRDGSCLAADPEQRVVYALKGGTNEFYAYDLGEGRGPPRRVCLTEDFPGCSRTPSRAPQSPFFPFRSGRRSQGQQHF